MAVKPSIQGLKREILELQTLYEISINLSSSLPLNERLHKVLDILHQKMGMARGTITILDSEDEELNVGVAHGIDEKTVKRGKYKMGEGITGKVVEAGKPIVVPNIEEEPLFLDRMKARSDLDRSKISFLCVPIKKSRKTIGALSVDRLFEGDVSYEEDIRLLTIISSILAQIVQIYQKREKEKKKLVEENQELKRELAKKFHPKNMVGESKRMRAIYDSIERVCQSKATILVRGETGTGKELIAHAVHYESDRKDGPFIKVSCAALPDTLLEAELFGYEKGAFTGATTSRAGRFERADGGTLFLDEIGDIPMSTQIKLLRVLQEKEFERIGGSQTIKVDIRLITATNRDLEQDVREGNFREDLYYRLNVIPLFLPALRDRKEDIPLLVDHFLKVANDENGKSVKYISDDAMSYLMNYAWPGNIREIQNAIERAVVLCPSDTIDQDLLPIPGLRDQPVLTSFSPSHPISDPDEVEVASAGGIENLPGAVEALEKKMIIEALKSSNGNKRRAAQVLGLTDRVMSYKVKNYAIDPKFMK